jgi:hypothetical protein
VISRPTVGLIRKPVPLSAGTIYAARRVLTSARSAVLAVGIGAAGVSGQAICSAPHSSTMLVQSGAIGTLPTGAGWLQLSFYGRSTDQGFNPRGDRQDFIGGSTFETRSLYLTAAYAAFDGLELWGQVPAHWLSVAGAAGSSDGQGIGDLRAALRISPTLVGYDAPVTVRFGLKLPMERLPVDARVLPLTEGQTDLELSVESGWAAGNLPVYVAGWVGHRWRGENQDERLRPGNELFAHATMGGTAGRFSLEVGIDAMWGRPPIDQGLELESAGRRLIQVVPTVGADLGPGRLELTTPIDVSGRNLPAGVAFSIGYRTVWGL